MHVYVYLCYYNCEFLCTYIAVAIDIDNNVWHKFYRLINNHQCMCKDDIIIIPCNSPLL